jgi:predicted DNA-binding protein with PD1-like motif
VLMYFDWDKKDYRKIPVREQVEVASLIGDVAEAPTGEPALHLHLVVGKRDGSAMAGHLGEARPLKSSLPKVRRTCARSKTRNRDWRSSGLQRDQAHRLNSHTASGTI